MTRKTGIGSGGNTPPRDMNRTRRLGTGTFRTSPSTTPVSIRPLQSPSSASLSDLGQGVSDLGNPSLTKTDMSAKVVHLLDRNGDSAVNSLATDDRSRKTLSGVLKRCRSQAALDEQKGHMEETVKRLKKSHGKFQPV